MNFDEFIGLVFIFVFVVSYIIKVDRLERDFINLKKELEYEKQKNKKD